MSAACGIYKRRSGYETQEYRIIDSNIHNVCISRLYKRKYRA